MSQRITLRTADRLQRAAFDFEYLAERLRAAGHEREANGVRTISSQLGNIGRELYRKLSGQDNT